MRRFLFCWMALSLLAGTPARAEEDIVDVLRRSHDLKLANLAPAEGERVQIVRASFERLLQALPPDRACDLQVIRGTLMAETLHGHVIVANQSLADLPEGTRLFVLAHELAHVRLQHWPAMVQVYQRWIPGAVTPDLTDPVAAPLGREASALAHQQEFAADTWAARALRSMGLPQDDLLAVFRNLGATPATPTHPSTVQRLASLRALSP
ncbi:conserved exported hypothetical protein [Rubrivivax sp. A210]|uniref:M48 family metalloprotease n=1 Tax=Rubrivivax sp. A210 TaxID=2772301 RepID=UPI001918DFC3|nr:M48 family metalloprotease [Rubrivivax sp. A210]CAD5372152.1 conserved exported hypothetical protein [Rubrivivax sp. A210]